jgi:hypothetical protein
MLNWLLSIFGGGFVNNTIDRLTTAYMTAKDSQVESERTRADVLKTRLDNEIEAQKLAQQVRLATAGFWEMRVLTFLIAAPFVLHAGLVGLDTCFSLGWRIPAYPPPFNEWEGAILLSFFGLHATAKGVNAIAAAFIARRS